MLGVITEVTVKILKKPQTVRAALIGFPSIEDGGNCVSEIISNGIVPAGMEMMDKSFKLKRQIIFVKQAILEMQKL